jgi:putative Mg2+ transporter-C (MgtC) family protein
MSRGGMRIVYEAEQVSLSRRGALEVLPGQALKDAKQKRRFEREARAAANLYHTNIVPVFGVGERGGLPCYVIQYIQGLGLDTVLEGLNHTKPADFDTLSGGMMPLIHFILNIGAALVVGVAIGLERQYRQHPASLRTDALVCVGAALFVSLSHLMEDTGSPTRIASYIVSGVGFLGGGVILREGLNVKGMNTAATLWCSAAVGTLAGAGFPLHGLIGTATDLELHLGLRPVARRIDSRLKTAVDVETSYQMRVVCREQQACVIRTILLRHVNSLPKMTIQRISIQEAEQDGRASVVADIYSVERNDRAIQELMSRINIEPSVASVSWEKVHEAGA